MANKPATALAPQSTEKSVEFQAFGSNEKVQLSINIVRKWLVAPTKSGKTASDSDVMKFIMLCKARQLNPWEGDAFLVGYDSQGGPSFSLITAHQAFLKRAEAHGQYDGMKSGVIVEDPKRGVLEVEGDFVLTGQKLLGGWCDVYRKDHTHPKKARLKLETFDKGFGQWKINGSGMIVKCAEADALRGSFPNTLGGLFLDAETVATNGNGNHIAEPTPLAVISEEQRSGLVALAQELCVVEKLGQIVNDAGFDMLAHITVDRFDDVEKAIRAAAEIIDGEIVTDEPDHTEPEVTAEDPPDTDEPEESLDEESVGGASKPISPLESLRANVQSRLDELPKTKRNNLLAGKPLLRDTTESEITALNGEIDAYMV